nr:hypothetical protein [Tanacetum cinerariifolium]
SEPWRYYGEDSAEIGPSRVIVYGYDGILIQLVSPPSLDYVPRPEHPPSPDYVPGPEHPPSPIEIPYDPEEEPFEEDEEEEEEHPVPADSPVVPIVDLVLSSGETEALEDDEPTHAPGSPISIPLFQTRLRRARKT